MNLSVLIPVYNRDVTLLVSSLATLLTKEKIVSEIILLDDASEPEFDSLNQHLAEADFIFYSRNESNLGRTVTRKILAEQAKYDYLLFLDCDVKITGPDFISIYHEQMKKGVDACCGGRICDPLEPDDNKLKLHWRYGTFREGRQGVFLSTNLLIRKKVFLELNFDSLSNQYGHEDTLWKINLEQKGANLGYIVNPVMHEGIEESSVFINKSLLALENLILLEKIVGEKKLVENVKLYEWYKKFSRYYITDIIVMFEKWFHSFILRNLSSYDPSLKYFDWMRLAHFIRLKKAAK